MNWVEDLRWWWRCQKAQPAEIDWAVWGRMKVMPPNRRDRKRLAVGREDLVESLMREQEEPRSTAWESASQTLGLIP